MRGAGGPPGGGGTRGTLAFGGFLVAGVALFGCQDGAPVARIDSPEGEERLTVRVELAVTAEERMRGLRDRNSLPEDQGLLLVFPVTGEVCVVNDGVPFAIDAVFVDAEGVVTAVERAIPADDPTPRCHPLTRRVLELAAGVAATVGTGDRLTLH